MADGIVIREEVVTEFLRECNQGLSMLQSGEVFADSTADAAGPHGRLAGELRKVEDSWSIRREKLIESFESLLRTISEIRQKYADLDHALADLLSRREGGADTTSVGGAQPSAATDNTPAADPTGTQGGSAAPLAQAGSASTQMPDLPPLGGGQTAPLSAAPQPVGAQPPLSAQPDLPDLPDLPVTQDLPDVAPLVGQPSPDAAGDGAPLASIIGFAQRWAIVTGRPVGEVVALLVAGMGAAGLVPVALLAALGGTGKAGATTGGGAAAGQASGEASGTEAGVVGQPDGASVQDGQGGEASAPAEAGEATPGQGDAPDLAPDDLAEPDGAIADADAPALPPLDEAHELSVPVAAPEAAVPAAVADDLSFAEPAVAGPVADLPPLTSANADPASAGGAAPTASGGIELPPLSSDEPASGGGSAVAAAASLPDLTWNEGSATPLAAGGDALPALGGDTAVGAVPMAASGRGMAMGGIGASGGGVAPGSGASGASTSSPTAQKGAEQQQAREIIDMDDDGEEAP